MRIKLKKERDKNLTLAGAGLEVKWAANFERMQSGLWPTWEGGKGGEGSLTKNGLQFLGSRRSGCCWAQFLSSFFFPLLIKLSLFFSKQFIYSSNFSNSYKINKTILKF